MIKFLTIAAIALLFGIAAASSFMPSSNSTQQNPRLISRLDELESRLNVEIDNRIVLERQLKHEREQRLALASYVSELNAHNDALSSTSERWDTEENSLLRNIDGYQAQFVALTTAGLADDEAQRVVDLEAQMYQTMMSARYNNERINPRDLALNMQTTLRGELGDDQYALYLQTVGRPTSVAIRNISEDSAGQIAGLQSGDNILSYDGERVFNIMDLQSLTGDGIEGQTVIIEVERNGTPVTLAIPRGEIGISSNRDRRRGAREE